jgi:peptide/nickel transport system substrate-binding protein
MKRRKWPSLVLLMLLVLSMGTAGCGGAPVAKPPEKPPEKPVEKPVLFTFATSQEPSTLDPAAVYDGSDRITRLMYESLLQYKDSTGDVEPCLAESYTVSPDGKTYTFKLRKNVKFHDGTPFDAEAVKFSFNRMLKLGKGLAWAFKMVLDENSVQVVDPTTVKFVLKKPYPAFPGMVASRYAAPIISPSVKKYEKDGDLGSTWAKENGIGTGPYMFEKWTRNQEVTLKKFEGYWKGWSGKRFSGVVMRIVPEQSTQRMLVEKGEVLAATHISTDDVAVLKKNPALRVEQPTKSNFGFFISMNTKKKPFSDKRVREAISYAFPYKDTVEKAFLGQAARAVGPLPAAVPGHNPNVKLYETNIEKAKQLLKEAGYPNGGFTVSVSYMQGQDAGTRIFNVLTSTLKELGIKVEARPLTWGAMTEQLTKQSTAPSMVIGDWWDDYPDPDSYLGGMCSTFMWTAKNEADQYYTSKAIEKLLSDAAFEADPQKRQAIYNKVQEMLVAEAPAVWVLDYFQPTVLRANVKGYKFNPYYLMTFNVYDMYIE